LHVIRQHQQVALSRRVNAFPFKLDFVTFRERSQTRSPASDSFSTGEAASGKRRKACSFGAGCLLLHLERKGHTLTLMVKHPDIAQIGPDALLVDVVG
jgi:hypothetical protein